MPNNAHQLLSHPTNDCLLNRIKLTKNQYQKLKCARDDIRQCIFEALKNWANHFDNANHFFVEGIGSLENVTLTPRFRMQGSMQYGTANIPAHLPPQEIDLDDGMFLPTPSIQAAGETQPGLLVGGLFKVVETALKDLCNARDWILEQKDTCVRVKLNEGEHSHLDIPIYAVPKARYDEIALNYAKVMSETHDEVSLAIDRRDSIELLEEAYKSLASNEILLAHREEGWKRSDPRRLEGWFNDAQQQHGGQLQRICRLLKAWRDYRFEQGGPSSIALMWCVVQVYDQYGRSLDENRDDLALLKVASVLPNLLSGQVKHPVEGCPDLDEGWSPELRESFVSASRSMAAALQRAIHQGNTPKKVVADFEEVFGPRLPDNAEAMIEIDADLAMSVKSLLLELGDKTQPLPPTRKAQDERRYA